MTKTKYTGVYHHIAKDGTKTFHIRGKIKGKNYTEVIGSTKEGITAVFASNIRAKKHGIINLGDDSPMHKAAVFTLNEAAELYFAHIAHKSNTANAQSVYAKHIKIGNMTLAEISSNDLELFKVAKLSEKIVRRTNGKLLPLDRTYSKATVNKLIDLISAIFTYMSKYHNQTMLNPAKSVSRFKVDNRRERYLEEAEITQLLTAIRTDTKRRKGDLLELFVLLALTTGARMGGILNLTKSDINLSTGQIQMKDFKRDATYTAYIHDSVRPLLETQMKQIRPIDHIIGGRPETMDNANINKMLQPLLNRLFNDGLAPEDAKRRAVIHSLRHTFASHLAIAGTPIFTIQKLLNHAEIDQTMRYAKLMPNQGAVDVMGIKIH